MNPIRSKEFQKALIEYNTLSAPKQFIVSIFSNLAGLFSAGFKYQQAFTWLVHKFHSDTNAAKTAQRMEVPASILKKEAIPRKNQILAFDKEVERRVIKGDDYEKRVENINTGVSQMQRKSTSKNKGEKAPFDAETGTYLDVYQCLFDSNIQAKENRAGLSVYNIAQEQVVPLSQQTSMQFEKAQNLYSSEKSFIAAPNTDIEIETYLRKKGEKAFIIKSTDKDDTFVLHILKNNGFDLILVSYPFKINAEGKIEESSNTYDDIYALLQSKGTARKHFADPRLL